MFKPTQVENNANWSLLKPLLLYMLKFGGLFCFLYYGSMFIAGSMAPEGRFYFPTVKYLYYLDGLRDLILRAASGLLWLFGYETSRISISILRLGKSGINLGDPCLGYGVMSFWIAFIATDQGKVKRKLKWLAIGLFIICFINVIRVCFILLAGHYKWSQLKSMDHHSTFNIVAYILIFILIYIYSKKDKENQKNISSADESNIDSRSKA